MCRIEVHYTVQKRKKEKKEKPIDVAYYFFVKYNITKVSFKFFVCRYLDCGGG
jgi:hypothetical protein